jgi:hypothetical protein
MAISSEIFNRARMDFGSIFNGGACTTAAAQPPAASTPGAILAQMDAAMTELGPEPIGEWMRALGFPPEGWTLILPNVMRHTGPAIWPDYVVFTGILRGAYVAPRNEIRGSSNSQVRPVDFSGFVWDATA